MVDFQTKYTLIDEQDIPLVEGYSFEVRMAIPLLPYFQSLPGEGHEGWVLSSVRAAWLWLPGGTPTTSVILVFPHFYPGCWLFLKTRRIVCHACD